MNTLKPSTAVWWYPFNPNHPTVVGFDLAPGSDVSVVATAGGLQRRVVRRVCATCGDAEDLTVTVCSACILYAGREVADE